nr:hypothetical protein [Tanacetum cinerariifolium]
SSKQKVENSNFKEHLPPIATMADTRTMAEMLRAPTEGCAEAIVVPLILAKQLELKHSLINMMTSEQFFGLKKENPHDHIHQDSLNAAAGGNLLEKSPQDALTIIENKSKVYNSRSKHIASQVKACDVNSSSEIAKLTHAVNQQMSNVTTAMTTMLKQLQATPPPAPVKAVEETCVTYRELKVNIQGYVAAPAVNYNQGNSVYVPPGSGSLLSNTIANPNGKFPRVSKFFRIRDIGVKRIPLMYNKVTLRRRLVFLDKRRGGIGMEGPSRTIPLRLVMAFISPFGLAMVLLRRDPDPEVEVVFIWKKLAIIFLSSLV